jgi:hypothetical protein
MSRTPGALNKGPKKETILRIRIHAEEKAAIQAKAQDAGLSVTAWIVQQANNTRNAS